MLKSKLALGTVQFGLNYGVANQVGQVRPSGVWSILETARSNNVDVLDTAIAYGTSEEVLGKVGVCGFRVVTKLPSLPADQCDIAYWIRDQVGASLKRLGQEKLYGLLLHRPQDLSGSRGAQLIKALANLKNAGVAQKIGVSICASFLCHVFIKIPKKS